MRGSLFWLLDAAWARIEPHRWLIEAMFCRLKDFRRAPPATTSSSLTSCPSRRWPLSWRSGYELSRWSVKPLAALQLG